MGSSHSTGLRYVTSRMIATMTSVVYSRVPSMPLNAPSASAAVAAGPVISTLRPSPPDAAVSRIVPTTSPSRSQALASARTGTTICAAWPSSANTGGDTCPATPSMRASACTSASTLVRSAGVMPPVRS